MNIDDKNFLRELRKSNESALDYVMDEYAPLVKGIVAKVLSSFGNNGLVDECLSDVFVSVWQNNKNFKGEKDDFKNWIACIAKYKAIDYYRRNLTLLNQDNLDNLMLESSKDVEEEILSLESEKKIIKMINGLNETNKKIFIMKFFLGMKSDKIGEKLKLTQTAVDNRIFRERKKLKQEFIEIQREGI
ncbi:sigma-70 family RNA polymerase sigma factor [Clostridium lundense]|uniref:sigma-70 family RNA polymerase sigma factor n=1 Tax=Clostridium lundense TaxID=319475 RepID=UPI0004867539|nr:sigma-70 family RNA polymerase sigma factor [Clostridium lundense]